MTNTIALRLQLWFTSFMAPTTTAHKKSKHSGRETIEDKAERMIADGRYTVIRYGAKGSFWVGTCVGDHGKYAVFAVSQKFMDEHGMAGGRVGCNCRRGNSARLCSHATGAEVLRKSGGDE